MKNVNFKKYIGLVWLLIINSSFAQTITSAGIYDSTMHFRIIFNPPILLAGNDSLVVDADQDGVNDIELRTRNGELSQHCFGGESYISPENNTCQFASYDSLFVEPYKFNYGDSLNKTDTALDYMSFYPYTLTIAINIFPCAQITSWLNINKYIGFRILNATDTLYGWIDPYLTAADSMYINQIVCESLNPGTIYINNIHDFGLRTTISVYPNPFIDRINVSSNYIGQMDFLLFDLASRKILHQTFTKEVALNTEKLSKGIYIYEIRSKDGVIKKGKVLKD